MVTKFLNIDTDNTLSANSNERVPSQKAVKTYTDNLTTSKQNKVLDTPITVESTEQTTVEGALGAINTSLSNKQNQSLSSAITVDGTQQTTVEGTLNALNIYANSKQNNLTAGDNITINNNVISAKDTTYIAGTGISIDEDSDENLVISNTQTSAEWGNITGTLSNQTDLQNALNAKQDTLVSGTNIKTVNGNSLLGSGNVNVDGLPSQTGQSGKYLTTDGSNASWEIPIAGIPLFYHTFQDHLLNNSSWLRSDTFSWQSGAVYVSAYNHLVDDLTINVETLYCWNRHDKEVYTTKENPSIGDNVYIINDGVVEFASTINNISGNTIYPTNMQAYTRYSSGDINNQEVPITTETETIAGTTITFYRATDGHKIVLPDQESNVEAIYTTTGVAWYYILDTTNTRFKLPRSTHGNIVEKYQNGTEWYRVWSDGWCEQGGVVSVAQTPEGQDVNLLKSYGSTNYTLSISLNTVAASWSAEANPRAVQGLTSFHIQSGGGVNPSNMSWIAYGFLSTTPENPQYKYLYFYVGNTIQNETSVDVAELTEDLNGKSDIDLGNLSNAGKIVGSGLGMPSNTYDDLTSGASGTQYTAPADGWFYFAKWAANNVNGYVSLINLSNYMASEWRNSIGLGRVYIPAKKGDIVQADYDAQGNTDVIRFIYAEGSKSEQ